MFEKGKKPAKGMNDNEKQAKMNVIKDMRDMAASAMGDKLKNLKKPAPEAKKEDGNSMFDKAPSQDEGSGQDSYEEFKAEAAKMSDEELDKHLECLQEEKAKRESDKPKPDTGNPFNQE